MRILVGIRKWRQTTLVIFLCTFVGLFLAHWAHAGGNERPSPNKTKPTRNDPVVAVVEFYPGMAAEVTVDTSGLSAEQGQGGIRINYIPRDGGNTFSGSLFATFANHSMQSDNLTDDLKARGLPSPNAIKTNYDVNPGFGGPIRRDRMWFYFTGRVNRADCVGQNPELARLAQGMTDERIERLTRGGHDLV